MTHDNPKTLVGIDGCKEGWSVALEIDSKITLERHQSIESIFKTHENIAIAAIDMVIGLPAAAQKGGRKADALARKILGKRGSSVFSAPCRSAAYASNYPEALSLSRESSPEGIGLSKQTWHLGKKIREVDQYLIQNPLFGHVLIEVHPELSFYAMNGSIDPLPSKHSHAGINLRQQLLYAEGFPKTLLETPEKDDLDALACLWSAKRIAEKRFEKVPKGIITDEMGLQMSIHW